MAKKDDKKDVSVQEFINNLVLEAAEKSASDIHIEPLESKVRIRFRIDGVLQEMYTFPLSDAEHFINRLKVLSNLELGHIPVPEDGHFSLELYDVRVSIFPTINGEAATLRILNRAEMLMSMEELGMDAKSLETLKNLALKSYGMLLVTGPVGSGKTTTLYSMLHDIRRKERNIITLEDPVEYYFQDIRQSNVRPEVGFTFAKGMRSILRQDPDVIMIGEIRDPETAEQAIRASLTGRVVFSTIHSNTTMGTIARLIDMQIDRGLIAYALNGVVAQRLVRRICPACRTDDSPRSEYIRLMGYEKERTHYQKGKGCKECRDMGYKGRAGIFEVLEFDDELRALIVEKAPMNMLLDRAQKSGMKTLQQQALDLINSGITSLEEVVRVV